MHSRLNSLSRAAQWLAAGAMIVGSTLGAARAADGASERESARAQHRQEWVHARLERNANRLEITASQQAAWQEYANARLALAERHLAKPRGDLEPASLMKWRADRAAEAARKLAALADATAKLQAVLSPAQRQTLGQMAQWEPRAHLARNHRGWHDGSRGHHVDGRGDAHGSESDNEQGPDRPAA
jgi:hypothetical protein